MLGRKEYTPEEVAAGKQAVADALEGYRSLGTPPGGGFETQFGNTLALALDRYFVYRLRVVTGKDTNPLNELEMLADSLMHNGGILRAINAIKYEPERAVLGLKVGDPVRLSVGDVERLAAAFFEDLERKFL